MAIITASERVAYNNGFLLGLAQKGVISTVKVIDTNFNEKMKASWANDAIAPVISEIIFYDDILSYITSALPATVLGSQSYINYESTN